MDRQRNADQPSGAEVETQLARLLSSQAFTRRSRLQAFLRFVVEESLHGRWERIKGYTIGREVCGRADDFDPQSDAIVRVEAGRLRQRLAQYYLTEGLEDPVLIEVPTGAYVPKFSYRAVDREETRSEDREKPRAEEARQAATEESGGRVSLERAPALRAAALLLATLTLGTWSFTCSKAPGTMSFAAEGPTRIVVLPFDYSSDVEPHPFLDHGLVDELISSLATVPTAEILVSGAAADPRAIGEMAQTLGLDYVIRGSIRQQGDRARITVTVVDAKSSTVAMTSQYDETLGNVLDLQLEIARNVAESLAPGVTPEIATAD